MARGSTPLPTGSASAKAFLRLLLTSSMCLSLAHVARATPLSLCAEGGATPCPGSLEPASIRGGTPVFFRGPESPRALTEGTGDSKGPGAFTEGSGDPRGPEASSGGPEYPVRGLTGIFSAAPTPSPVGFINANATEECEEEGEACLADEECQGCYEIASGLASSEEFEACREAYLGVMSSSSTSSSSSIGTMSSGGGAMSSSTCDVVGATYCCSNEVSESDCLAGDGSSVYWGCVFESYGCELEEVSCLAVGDSYRSDDDDVGGRASNPDSGAMQVAPWKGVVWCVAVAAFSLAAGGGGDGGGMGMAV